MTEKDQGGNRRDFLKLAGAAAPAAAVALAAGEAGAEAADAPPGEGLRKTEHVRKYLETARF